MVHWQLTSSCSLVEVTDAGSRPWPLAGRLAAVAQALAGLRGWSVDRHVGYDDCTIVLATHDASGQEFVLSEAEGGVELVQAHEDRLAPCGTFAGAEAALAALAEAAFRGCN